VPELAISFFKNIAFDSACLLAGSRLTKYYIHKLHYLQMHFDPEFKIIAVEELNSQPFQEGLSYWRQEKETQAQQQGHYQKMYSTFGLMSALNFELYSIVQF